MSGGAPHEGGGAGLGELHPGSGDECGGEVSGFGIRAPHNGGEAGLGELHPGRGGGCCGGECQALVQEPHIKGVKQAMVNHPLLEEKEYKARARCSTWRCSQWTSVGGKGGQSSSAFWMCLTLQVQMVVMIEQMGGLVTSTTLHQQSS